MTPILSRDEMRELDRAAIEEGHVPSLVLMENAGRGAAEIIERVFGDKKRVVIVCGAGNNGGDGFVVGRRLLARGFQVRALLIADVKRLRGDALENYKAYVGVGGSSTTVSEDALGPLDDALRDAQCIVDAIFGTGLDREIGGLERNAIERINAAKAPCVSLDLPSGLDADTGVPRGAVVRAELTVTFAHKKRALRTPLGETLAGRVEVVDIGIPSTLAERVGYGAAELEASDAALAVVPRTSLSHKGSSGRVLVVAGSPGKIGAALLSAHGALRGGAGLVTIAAQPAAVSALEQRVLEAMTARIDPNAVEPSLTELLENTDVVAIGPGLGHDDVARNIVNFVVLEWQGTVVVDADAVTHFKGRASDLSRAKGKLILTPHPGEMARLLAISGSEFIEADRFAALATAVEQTRATVLLKGAATLVGAPGQKIAVNPTGHPVLATGGSGDVLTGVIAALATGSEPFRAACAGAYLHGMAGSIAAREHGLDRGVLAHEIADQVPRALAALSAEPRRVPV
jgi:ADP-dependent NAD(P)H-hydrate dehydratase / NAD(P)H-hydrate epimerase